ncbi:MAG: malonate decarboxylase acyl carrier protein [Burkholderiales bacterium]
MEQLEYALQSASQARDREPVLVGVVGSGNCEVLVEGGGEDSRCDVTVNTSALGFAPVWEAVLRDFAARCRAGRLKIEINDVGATPAVVSLRLDQAIEAWEEGN